MRIIAFPFVGIAYTKAFYAAVQAQGGEVVEGNFSGRWLLNNLKKADIVHLHWPSFLYLSSGGYLEVLLSFSRFLMLLAMIRLKGSSVCWTAHNLLPHQRCIMPSLDNLARHIVIEMSSRIFVHGIEAERVLNKCFPRSRTKCVVIPHGNWIGSYKPAQARESARIELGLPENKFIYLCFGQCKPYKNLEGLIRAFRREASASDYLLIAGSFSNHVYYSSIETLVGNDSRIRIDAKFIAEDEVSVYLSASDAVCIPYHKILTSGVAMLSLSFGKPVVSIDKGFLRDVIIQKTGILVQPGNDIALASALRDVRDQPWCSEEIVQHAKQYSFDDAARTFLNAIKPTP